LKKSLKKVWKIIIKNYKLLEGGAAPGGEGSWGEGGELSFQCLRPSTALRATGNNPLHCYQCSVALWCIACVRRFCWGSVKLLIHFSRHIFMGFWFYSRVLLTTNGQRLRPNIIGLKISSAETARKSQRTQAMFNNWLHLCIHCDTNGKWNANIKIVNKSRV
jgi:hypothetical protein